MKKLLLKSLYTIGSILIGGALVLAVTNHYNNRAEAPETINVSEFTKQGEMLLKAEQAANDEALKHAATIDTLASVNAECIKGQEAYDALTVYTIPETDRPVCQAESPEVSPI